MHTIRPHPSTDKVLVQAEASQGLRAISAHRLQIRVGTLRENLRFGGSMAEPVKFLSTTELRSLDLQGDGIGGLRGIALGNGNMALEVVVCESRDCPTSTQMRSLFKKRQAGRATPVLIVVLYGGKAAVCGPIGDDPPSYMDLDVAILDRICSVALSEPDRHAALRFLKIALPDIGSPIPGLRNEGFFASHELQTGVPKRKEWDHASRHGREALKKSGRELVRTLGFDVKELPNQMSVLIARDKKVAVAIFLEKNESSDIACERYSGLTPVSRALSCADQERLPYVMIVSDRKLRLYPVSTGVGVGRRGRTETFIEAHLDIIPEPRAAYLWYLFSSEALCDHGFLDDILDRSNDYSADLGKRLRERIYDSVIPQLAMGIADVRGLKHPSPDHLRETYQMALAVLFRLLFVAYAEDKELLPCRSNEAYRRRSLKQKAHELLEFKLANGTFDEGTSHWREVGLLFDAVDKGQAEWGVPAYDGSLFSRDVAVNRAGAALAKIALRNDLFGPILADLLLDQTDEGVIGPVDFRSLGVREFGTIYEGLLESQLAVAETDLTVDKEGLYRPALSAKSIRVKRGQVYLTGASGARKSLGSFFTKSFAVNHLLDYALEPKLDEHIRRLDELGDNEAGDAFFDVRIADIAMGSGHFLVAAVDRIERHLSSYLTRRPIPSVIKELNRLRQCASEALGPLSASVEIEDTQLLRRQIARRCIYGVDLNPQAVDLARLSLWIHTFVPGLPLSLLNHHLVQGNSLVGIATVQEAKEIIGKKGALTMFDSSALKLMNEVAQIMERVGHLNDANAAEIEHAKRDLEKAKEMVTPWSRMMDIIAASRVNEGIGECLPDLIADWVEDPSSIESSDTAKLADTVMEAIPPFHFQVVFPDVFWRDTPGFDVIVGNPPWDKLHVEEHEFWARHFPGIRGTTQREREKEIAKLRTQRPDLVKALEREVAAADLARNVISTGPFPGMGSGHPDLYKAFCWRFWQLLRTGGFFGVVLPRSAIMAYGSSEFRIKLFTHGRVRDLTLVLNRGGWVFDDAEHRYTIALLSAEKSKPRSEEKITLRGPFADLKSFLEAKDKDPLKLDVSSILEWTETAALPQFPSEDSPAVFMQMRKAPSFGEDIPESWRTRPLQGDINATTGKHFMTFSGDRPRGFWPIYSGESFEMWTPDRGRVYAWADPAVITKELQRKRLRAAGNRRSVFGEMPDKWLQNPETLPCLHPRIAFRDVARSTDSRTVITALVPPRVVLTHKAPYLVLVRGDHKDEAYLLGVMSSRIFDWYARRFVETTLSFSMLMSFPVPRPRRSDPFWRRIVEVAAHLASIDDRYDEWARVAYSGAALPEKDKKDDLTAELDALVARIYGLDEGHLRNIYETFHETWDYEASLQKALRYFKLWPMKASKG